MPTPKFLLAALLALTPAMATAQPATAPSGPSADSSPATDIDRLLRVLARPAPARTPFVEQRGSALLEQPLWLSGELTHPRPGVLVKTVHEPYAERTTIADGQVEIERARGTGTAAAAGTRRFSLRNAPELAGLLAGFEGVLAGDRALLERHYRLLLQRDHPRWTLRLQPRAPRLARRVEALLLSGEGESLRCMELLERDGDRSRLLLGATGGSTVEQGEDLPRDQAGRAAALAAACRHAGALD